MFRFAVVFVVTDQTAFNERGVALADEIGAAPFGGLVSRDPIQQADTTPGGHLTTGHYATLVQKPKKSRGALAGSPSIWTAVTLGMGRAEIRRSGRL